MCATARPQRHHATWVHSDAFRAGAIGLIHPSVQPITEADAKRITKLVLESTQLRCAVLSLDANNTVDKWRPGKSIDDIFNREMRLVADRPGEWYYGSFQCRPVTVPGSSHHTECVRDGMGIAILRAAPVPGLSAGECIHLLLPKHAGSHEYR